MSTASILLALFAAPLGAPATSAVPALDGVASPQPIVEAQEAEAADAGEDKGFEDWLDHKMHRVNVFIGGGDDPDTKEEEENAFGFFQLIPIGVDDSDGEPIRVPLLVMWLVLGSIFFTVRMAFVQFRVFRHAIEVTRGRYDDPEDEGEVSHFQALTAALSATVGLGNIAGVAIAISIGGPGATFWMIMAGFLGMASKFVECTLGQLYREVRRDGSVMGGAMCYLSTGLKEKGMGGLGKVLAVIFAVLCMGGSFAGGNSFQVNQSLGAIKEAIPSLEGFEWIYGLIMTAMVAVVIVGGIKRIAATAEKIVPLMCGIYVAACLIVLVMKMGEIPAAFGTILSEALRPEAGFGAIIGVLVVGFQRAAFSNEAGVGSAAIAHAAAKTKYPIREGVVASLGPFIDTVVICTMTALVIVITGAYNDPDLQHLVDGNNGAALTSMAMQGAIGSWFKYVLAIAVMFFAYSTMISWSYYGERCWVWLFGDASSMIYKMIFLVFVFLGSVVSATSVLEFGDLMILGMAFPNVLGVVILSGKVRTLTDKYLARLKAGEFKVYS
ncbi:MAG TPA: alanine/glycine:cation symporter family protein [Planctomycetota bacterium]|jgi:AGCS family alanine or glycine:cation symporter|nr:alanine/glycine:cation symporter family protein [Planctomycetota bacterium]